MDIYSVSKRSSLLLVMALLLSFSTSCANMGRWTQTIDPERVNKENLKDIPYETTPEYDFRVSISKKVPSSYKKLIPKIDRQFTEFSRCFDIQDGGAEARKYLIGVVDGTFECKYHGGKCNGEFDPGAGLIIVSYKAFNRKGTMPLLKHEWAHAYGILKSNHENLKKVQKCTIY